MIKIRTMDLEEVTGKNELVTDTWPTEQETSLAPVTKSTYANIISPCY